MKVMQSVQRNGRWYLEPTPSSQRLYDENMERDGLVKIMSEGESGTIARYVKKEMAIKVHKTWMLKIDAVLAYFGEEEWLDLLRSELGLQKEVGILGIHKLMASETTRARYRKLIDETAQLAKEALERQ